MLPVPERHPLRKMFRGLVENAFYTELGICDPELVDYLTDLMVAFIHVDQMHLLRDTEGKPLTQIGLMLAAALDGELPAECSHECAVHRHIADYALFWTGIYPERLSKARRRPGWRDWEISYVAHGKRSYAIASDLCDNQDDPPAYLLRKLSHNFEPCAAGLSLVRRGWETDDTGGSGELLY